MRHIHSASIAILLVNFLARVYEFCCTYSFTKTKEGVEKCVLCIGNKFHSVYITFTHLFNYENPDLDPH